MSFRLFILVRWVFSFLRVSRMSSKHILANKKSVFYVVLMLLCTLTTMSVRAVEPIQIQGSNTLRIEDYTNRGNPAGSPFAFEGLQSFNEFNLNANQQFGDYRRWQGQISGVLNDSEFRAQETGTLLIERWNLKAEYGDTGIPLRTDIGDYQAFFSLSTLQRSLKGAQIEFQPSLPGGQHSLQLLWGVNEASWRGIDFTNDQTYGLSWLTQTSQNSRTSINLIHNRRDDVNGRGEALNIDELQQQTLSVSNETRWDMLGRRWQFDGELSHFSGDTDFVVNGEDRSDNGLFTQVSSNHTQGKGDYRVRFERYGQDYRPNGAVVSSNRRSAELHASWRFDSGIVARGRVQNFRDGLELANPTDTQTVGLNLSGKLFSTLVPNLNGSLAAFVQQVDNRENTVDRNTESLNVNLSFPLFHGWNGRGSFSFNNADDRIGNGDSIARNYSFSASRSIQWQGFRGQLSPTLSYRQTDTTSSNKDMNLGLSASISKGSHQLSLVNGFNQNRPGLGVDSDTRNLAVNYRYSHGKNQFGLEFTENERDPENAEASVGRRASLFWTYNLNTQITGLPRNSRPKNNNTYSDDLDILTFAPGRELAKIALLQSLPFSSFGEFVVSESRMFSENGQRQRLIVKRAENSVEYSAVLIDFDDTGSLSSVAQIYEQTRQQLLRRYGAPDNFLERGEFDADFVQQLNNDGFIRSMEWQTDSGTLRFGLPRRLDGSVRMELHYSTILGPITETFWSVEEIL